MDLMVPEIVDNRYRVIDIIGTGAMATVYSAEDTRLGRKVAIKILRPEQAQDKTFRIRFKREAEAVASLNYPAIVAVYDTGAYSPGQGNGAPDAPPLDEPEENRIPYIVMELLAGRTLRDILSSGAHLPVQESIAYAEQLLGALQYSHDKGIIHRDIKPANIMVLPLTEEDISMDRSGQIKVMDFGIARAMEAAGEALTKANVVLGSARYMSPEQVSGHEVDTRSDIYSAACVIYEMLAGRTPFDAESNVDLAAKHLSEVPQPPSAFSPLSIPPALDAAVMRGLAKNPHERYQSAEEFSQALQLALNPEDGKATVAQDAFGNAIAAGTAAAAAEAAALPPYDEAEAEAAPFTDTVEPVSDEEAHLNDFFAQDYDSCEEYVEPEPSRRRSWMHFLVGALIAALIAFSIGSFLYYQNRLNEVPKVTVPSVTNVSKDDADNQLRNLGFSLEYKSDFSDKVKKGDIISVDPGPGSKVDKGSNVTLTVSNGPKNLSIPDDWHGQSEAYVRNAIKEMGLTDGRVSTVESPDVPAGMVVSVSDESGEVLEPGTNVEAGQTVDLVLSSGKVKVPSLVGLTKDEAIAELTGPETRLSTKIETVQTNSAPSGTVVSQDISAGSLVNQNTEVTIRVASPAATTRSIPATNGVIPTRQPQPTSPVRTNPAAVPTAEPTAAQPTVPTSTATAPTAAPTTQRASTKR